MRWLYQLLAKIYGPYDLQKLLCRTDELRSSVHYWQKKCEEKGEENWKLLKQLNEIKRELEVLQAEFNNSIFNKNAQTN